MQIPIEIAEIKPYLAVIGYNCREEIPRCLDPWVNHVQGFILGDGKFPEYPGSNDYSTDGWLDFAYDRYKDAVDVQLYRYAGRQQDKRQRYLDIAGELKCDYLIVMDTDDYIDPSYQDFNTFYRQLVLLDRVTKDRTYFMYEWIPSPEEWPAQGNYFMPNAWRHSVRIHKDPGTMRYCANSHYRWCPKEITDKQIYDWEHERFEAKRKLGMSTMMDPPFHFDNPFLFQTRNFVDGVRIKMDRCLRSKEQIEAGAEWAFLNQHEERFGEHCAIQVSAGRTPPEGFESWTAYRNTPHKFDKETGKIILL